MDEEHIRETIQFLMDSGPALLLLTHTKDIGHALEVLMEDTQKRIRVCNFYGLGQFSEIWFHYNKMTEREKSLIENEINKQLKR